MEDGREIAVVEADEDPPFGRGGGGDCAPILLYIYISFIYFISRRRVRTSSSDRSSIWLLGSERDRKQRRGRRFVKFLRSLIARLLAMQRERRAYYQLG